MKTPEVRYKRELIEIKFSKNGIDQNWLLRFNNDRLLTDKVFVGYSEPVYLKTIQKCKTLEDVINFLKVYSYFKKSAHTIINLDTQREKVELSNILKLRINFKKVSGEIYWGSYTIVFDNGFMYFYRNIPKVLDYYGEIINFRNLLNITEKIVGRLQSREDFLSAVKKLEIN